MIMGSDLFTAMPLPKSSSLTIGRADDADIHITDPLASRLHARLHLGEGGLIEIEDVGSINKTKVRDVPLTPGERVAVLPGEAITIGSTILMVQETRVTARPRRVWPHTYFEARTEEECGRSAETRAPFVVARLSVDGNAPPGVVADAIAPALRPSDMLALFAPSEYEMLMPTTSAELGVAIAQDVVARLRGLGIGAHTGLASHPRDGQTPEALAARASERLRGIDKPVVAGDKVIVEDARMRRLYQLARSAAAGVINVLIVGETGVGKDVMAEAIHRMSPRAKAPFLSLNCTAVSESLLESELFGHEKGAFTGATETKAGLLETAPGGTVFLDEIGDMPLQLQAKLLRVIETRQISRVGSLKARAIDVRFVAATNRNLEADIAAGRFRRDLYYRLNGMSLQIPPLRERRSEIVPLARSFLAQFAAQAGLAGAPPLSDEAAHLLEVYPWQGNARELRNVMERALLLCDGSSILPEHLPLEAMAANSISFAPADSPLPPSSRPPAAAGAGGGGAAAAGGDVDDRDYVMRVLNEHGGNQSRAAKALGIARSTLIARLEAWGIPRPRK